MSKNARLNPVVRTDSACAVSERAHERQPMKKLSDAIGVVGILGEILALTNKIPFPEIFGTLCSIVLFFWGIFEKSTRNKFIRAVACTCLVVAPITFVCFALVAYVIRLDREPSQAIGDIVARKTDRVQVSQYDVSNELRGEYAFKFNRPADVVQAIFAPSDKDLVRIERINILPIIGQIEKLVRTEPEDALLVMKPSRHRVLRCAYLLPCGRVLQTIRQKLSFLSNMEKRVFGGGLKDGYSKAMDKSTINSPHSIDRRFSLRSRGGKCSGQQHTLGEQ